MYPPNQQQQQPQLPHQPPPHLVPQVSVTQQFMPLVPLATGMALMMAMQTAKVSPFREAYVNALSQNNWQNQMFQMLAKATCQVGEVLLATQQGAQVEQTLQNAAEQCLSMLTAQFVHQNHMHFPQLQDQRVGQAIHQLLQKWQGVEQEVGRFYARFNQPQSYGHNNYGQQIYNQTPMGYQNGMLFNQNQRTPIGDGALGMGAAPAAMPTNTSYSNPYKTAQDEPAALTYTSNLTPQAEEGIHYRQYDKKETADTGILEELTLEPTKTPAVEPLLPINTSPAAASAPAPKATPVVQNLPEVTPLRPLAEIEQQVSQGSVFEAMPTTRETVQWHIRVPDQEWPKIGDLQRPWDAVLLEDGTELRPAAISGWTVPRTAENPYALAYDKNSQILFHMRSKGGVIVEHVLNWEESMEYLEHELDRAARQRYRQSSERKENIGFDLSKVNRLQQIEDSPLALVTEAPEATEEVPADVKVSVVERGIVVSNIKDANRRIRLFLQDEENAFDSSDPYEYYVDVVTPNVIEKAATQTLVKAVNAGDFEKLHELVSGLEDKEFRAQVDARLTKQFNQVLKNNIGVTQWSISSFLEDYHELVKMLGEHYGDDVGQKFNEFFDAIAGAAIGLSEDDETQNFSRTTLALREEDFAGSSMELVSFCDRISITVLPWTLAQLGVEVSKDGPSLVNEDTLPNLHEALAAILARAVDFPQPYSAHYLLLTDETVLELYAGYLIDGSILLRQSSLTRADF